MIHNGYLKFLGIAVLFIGGLALTLLIAPLVGWLAPPGFELLEAANGQEALEIWQAWQPQLIWLDMRMPVIGQRISF